MAQAKRAAEADPKKRRLEEAEGMVELEIEVMEGARRRRRRSVDTVEDGEEEEKMRPVVVYNIPLGRGFLNVGHNTISWKRVGVCVVFVFDLVFSLYRITLFKSLSLIAF
mmetsp:Transcript_32640/g.75132  ORF Transcript_32640/g.75132 Transcript_32640/m.75132 type:complete len:110 (+) Transcript_32640:774-1103(+)